MACQLSEMEAQTHQGHVGPACLLVRLISQPHSWLAGDPVPAHDTKFSVESFIFSIAWMCPFPLSSSLPSG